MTYSTHYIAQSTTRWLGIPEHPGATYNTLTNGFNVSTCILVAAAVAALVGSFAVSSVFIALGLLLRSITDKELYTYQCPGREANEVVMLKYALGIPGSIDSIFENVHKERPQNWAVDAVRICDLSLWKNQIGLSGG